MSSSLQIGQVRVGRINTHEKYFPSISGFTPTVVMTKSYGKYAALSPYLLRDENGYILENRRQASKIYNSIPRQSVPKSRFDKTVIWEYSAQIHTEEEEKDIITAGYNRFQSTVENTLTILPEYWIWREKLMNNIEPVRYPAGYHNRHNCIGAIVSEEDEELIGYIESRKKIYIPIYLESVVKEKLFEELKNRLEKGENLLILEVDGPHQESLSYYKVKYKVTDDFIVDSTVLATEENLKILLNDTKHPYGHGYCLAMALLDIKCD